MTDAVQNNTFFCGVIEGFYGKPWTAEQRKELFLRMQRFGMETYMYAPKDDYKHRLYWRDLYTEEEADDLKELIESAAEFGVKFVYAISPGLDIIYTDKEDVNILKNKLDQVKGFGCNSYALLFDDIDPDLSPDDSRMYSSVGQAQSELTNQIFKYVGSPDVFLFCPTEYCTSRADPTLQKSEYLKTIGKLLHPDIHILWTGPKVVSRRITVESIIEVKEILKRPPTIWDNIHANDYDQTRVYLGPYDGRPQEMSNHVRGVLTNPNCEFEVNFIAMHTLAQWSKNTIQRFPTLDADAMEVDPPKTGYQPKRALFCAIEDWIPEFYKPKGASPSKKTLEKIASQKASETESVDPTQVAKETKSSEKQDDDKMEIAPTNSEGETNNETSQTEKVKNGADKSESCTKYAKLDGNDKKIDTDVENVGSPMDTTKDLDSSKESETLGLNLDTSAHIDEKPPAKIVKEKRRIDTIDCLEMEDLLVLCDLFYLPYEYGPRALHLLKRGHWLSKHADRVMEVEKKKIPIAERPPEVQEWYEKAIHFHDAFREAVVMVDKLVNIPNRMLLYELYNYVSDMRCALSLVNSYVKWNGMGKPDKEPFRGGEQEPWVHRSGIYSEFRRLLPIEGASDMFPKLENQPEPLQSFTIRPYFPEDKDDVYSVCLKTCDDGMDGSDLFVKYPDLPAEDSIGGILELFPQYCYVIEDDSGICGYVVCAKDVREYQERIVKDWLSKMRNKYPDPCPTKEDDFTVTEEVIKTFHKDPIPIPEKLYGNHPGLLFMSVLSNRVDGIAASRRLLKCALTTLKACGTKGVHTMLHSSHFNRLTYYTRLEFVDLSVEKNLEDDILIMGRPI